MNLRRTLRKLLASNPFILGFSFLLAFGIWLGVTVSVAPEETRVFARVPVTIDMSEVVENLGLEAFVPQDGIFVEVTVRGKRYVLNEVTAEQISVSATTAAVGSAGIKTLRISATRASSRDFQILPLSQQEINVLFDERREQEFQLETVLLDDSGKVIKDKQTIAPKGYIVDHELLSASSVTLSGPASEIARIKSVTATAQLVEKLTETAAFTASVAIHTTDGATLQFVNVMTDEVTMTIPIYKNVTLPVTVEWLNAPAAYTEKPLNFTCRPRRAQFGISESQLEEITSITIGAVDFALLPANAKTEFSFPAAEIRQHRLLSGEEVFRVTVDTTGTRSNEFAVPHNNIQMINAPQGIVARVAAGSLDAVTVAGSSRSIRRLDSTDIYAEADLENITTRNAEITMPVRVFVRGYDDCWVIGEYEITLMITLVE